MYVRADEIAVTHWLCWYNIGCNNSWLHHHSPRRTGHVNWEQQRRVKPGRSKQAKQNGHRMSMDPRFGISSLVAVDWLDGFTMKVMWLTSAIGVIGWSM